MPDRKTVLWLLCSLALVSGVLFGWKICIVDPWAERTISYASAGQFGDAFAPVTTFFSALAFIAALASFSLQRKDLKEQGEASLRQAQILERAIAHMGGQEEAVREQSKQQAMANRLAVCAAHLSAYSQIAEIDRTGHSIMEDRVPLARALDLPELEQTPLQVWFRLTETPAEELFEARWRQKVCTELVQNLLLQRRVIWKIVEQIEVESAFHEQAESADGDKAPPPRSS